MVAIDQGNAYLTSGTVFNNQTFEISTIDGNGTTLSITSLVNHNLSVGDEFEVTGTSQYNTKYIVATVGSTTTLTAASTLDKPSESTGNIVYDFITGGTTVKIDPTTKIDYQLDNDLVVIPIPKSGDRTSTNPHTQIVDLKKIRETIAIQGSIAEETSEAAIEKRNNLITFMKQGNELTLVWGRGTYQTLMKPNDSNSLEGVIILRLQFTESSGLLGESKTGDPAPERTTDVQIALVRGQDITKP